MLIYNVVLMSAVEQGDSVIHTYIYIYIYIYTHTHIHTHTHTYIFFKTLFHYGLSKNIEYNPLCYAVGLCLSISIYNGLH